MNITNIVYHYCPLESFFSIISESKLRLSHALKSNDSDEISLTYRIAQQIVDNLDYPKPDFGDTGVFSSESIADSYNKMISAGLNVLRTITQAPDVTQDACPYIACFSPHSDQLSQWAMYADDGKGVAIGFKVPSLVLLDKECDYFDFYNVKYNDSDLEYDVYTTIHEVSDIMFRHGRSKLESLPAVDKAVFELDNLGVRYKNMCFCDEEERRLVFRPKKYDAFTKIHSIGFDLSGPEYLVSNGIIKSFWNLSMADSHKDSIIAEIVLGPKCKIDEKDSDLRDFLNKNLFLAAANNISKSKATYI